MTSQLVNQDTSFRVKFKVKGNLRFLSHSETVNLMIRACARARIILEHSQGFNPRPKISLPLPRPVAVASDDELMVIKINAVKDVDGNPLSYSEFDIKNALQTQMPLGIELLDVKNEKKSVQPASAEYRFSLTENVMPERVKNKISDLMNAEQIFVERISKPKQKAKKLEVRRFIKTIDLVDRDIFVKTLVTQNGSIRIDEIMELLDINQDSLEKPAQRTNIEWS